MQDRHHAVFSDRSQFCVQHHDGLICVWRYRGERKWAACIRYCHTGAVPSLMENVGTQNEHLLFPSSLIWTPNKSISELRLVAVSFLWGITDVIFQKDNARPYVVLTYLNTEGDRLLSWPTQSPDFPSLKISDHWAAITLRVLELMRYFTDLKQKMSLAHIFQPSPVQLDAVSVARGLPCVYKFRTQYTLKLPTNSIMFICYYAVYVVRCQLHGAFISGQVQEITRF